MSSGSTSSGEWVLFTIATDGYGPFVLNLHASLARLGLGDDLVVYALDAKVHRTLQAAGVHSVLHAPGRQPAWSAFGSPAFRRTMAYKYAIALQILNREQLAYYVDSDIVFLRDPTEHLHRVLAETSADLVMQIEAPMQVYNAGFWIARPTAAVRELFAALGTEPRGAGEYPSDQKTLNRWITKTGRVLAHPLDPELFACGNQFLRGIPMERGGYHVDRSLRPFPIEAAYVLHFNFLTTREHKAAAMARHGAIFHPALWSVDRSLTGRFRRWLRWLRPGR